MKLHSPTFEKGLRRAVRKKVLSSPQLRREVRKLPRRQLSGRFVFRPLLSVLLGLAVFGAFRRTEHLETAAALLNLWVLYYSLSYATAAWRHIYTAADIPALGLLPLRECDVFKWELQAYVRHTAWLGLDLIAGFGVLVATTASSPAALLGVVPVALIGWVQSLATGLFLLAFAPRFPAGFLAGLMMFLGFGIMVARDFAAAHLLPLLDRAAGYMNLLLPTGWLAHAVASALQGHYFAALVLLSLCGVIIWSAKLSTGKLLATYKFVELEAPAAPDLLPGGSEKESASCPEKERPPRIGPTEIEEMICSRRFLQLPLWPQTGWVESFFWKLLTHRERAVCEFVFPQSVCLTLPWKRLYRDLTISALVLVATDTWAPPLRIWTLLAAAIVCLPRLLMHFFNSGQGFAKTPDAGLCIPMFAGYAISHREIWRVLLKLSLAQVPLVLPAAVVCGLLAAHIGRISPSVGAITALKGCLILFYCRVFYNTLQLSSCTNDTTASRWRAFVVFCWILPPMFAFVAFGIAAFILPAPLSAWGSLGMAGLMAWLLSALYSRGYSKNKFDLLSRPQQQL